MVERRQEHGLRVGGTAEVLSSWRSRVTGKDGHGVKHKRSHFGSKVHKRDRHSADKESSGRPACK